MKSQRVENLMKMAAAGLPRSLAELARHSQSRAKASPDAPQAPATNNTRAASPGRSLLDGPFTSIAAPMSPADYNDAKISGAQAMASLRKATAGPFTSIAAPMSTEAAAAARNRLRGMMFGAPSGEGIRQMMSRFPATTRGQAAPSAIQSIGGEAPGMERDYMDSVTRHARWDFGRNTPEAAAELREKRQNRRDRRDAWETAQSTPEVQNALDADHDAMRAYKDAQESAEDAELTVPPLPVDPNAGPVPPPPALPPALNGVTAPVPPAVG